MGNRDMDKNEKIAAFYEDYKKLNNLEEDKLIAKLRKGYIWPCIYRCKGQYEFNIDNIYGKKICNIGSIPIDASDGDKNKAAIAASLIAAVMCDRAFPDEKEKNFARNGEAEIFIYCSLLKELERK